MDDAKANLIISMENEMKREQDIALWLMHLMEAGSLDRESATRAGGPAFHHQSLPVLKRGVPRSCVLCKGGYHERLYDVLYVCLPDCIAHTALITCTLSPARVITECPSCVRHAAATNSSAFLNKHGSVIGSWLWDMLSCRSTSTC